MSFSQEFVTIIIGILGSANFCALVALILQLRHATKWNKLQSKYNFIDTDNSRLLEIDMINSTNALGLKLYGRNFEPLTQNELERLYNNEIATLNMNYFINDLENLCTARRKKILNKNVFRLIHQGRVGWWYCILKPYVNAMRKHLRDDNLWCEFEKYGIESGSQIHKRFLTAATT